MALIEDISYSYEERRRKWMARHDASNDVEEFIMSRCASMASKLERIERADAERFRTRIEKADEKEHEEVLALGKCLFFNRCGSMGTYGLKPSFALEIKTSFSGLPLEPDEPFAIVEKLESSELGTMYLLDVWYGLRARLEPGKFWQGPDRFQAIRLLGHQPIDARFDEEIAAIFYASAKLEPGKPEPFRELASDLDADQLTELRKEVPKRCPELAALKNRAKGRQILLDIVDRSIERLEAILKTHEENADAEAERVVAREGVDTSPRGKQLNDYELKYHRELRQSIVVYEKLTGERRGAWNGKDETWRGGSARGEPIAPPAYGTGSGGEQNRVATGLAAGGSRSEPATLGREERGWESVKVEAEDVVACQGLLPERCFGLSDADPPVSGEDAARERYGLAEADVCGDVERFAGESEGPENATNEPGPGQDMITTQNEENVEVVANSGDFSRLDKLRTNPRPECRRDEEEGVESKSETPNSKSEGGRDLGEIRDGDHELDAGCADMLSRTACAETLTPALSRGKREIGSKDPASVVEGSRPRAERPPLPAAGPTPREGRNARRLRRHAALGGRVLVAYDDFKSVYHVELSLD